VVVFFVPTIVSALFNILNITNMSSGDSNICVQCVTNVNSCDTSGVAADLGN